jgi:hypothetical protein
MKIKFTLSICMQGTFIYIILYMNCSKKANEKINTPVFTIVCERQIVDWTKNGNGVCPFFGRDSKAD